MNLSKSELYAMDVLVHAVKGMLLDKVGDSIDLSEKDNALLNIADHFTNYTRSEINRRKKLGWLTEEHQREILKTGHL
jgi:hypothetical protein